MVRKGTDQMAGAPKAHNPTLSPDLAVFFSCPERGCKTESTAGYFYPLPLLLLSYTKVFLLQGWVHGGTLCTVKNVNRKKRPVFLVDLATLSLVHDILSRIV